MAKYINAELLRQEIERLKEEYNKQISAGLISESLVSMGKVEALNKVLAFIESLQQEQPDCHTVEDWIQHIKNADQLTKDIFSKGPYDVLYDALNYPYRHCYDAIKEFGELCFQTGVNSIKQEQPSLSSNLDDAANKFAVLYDQGTCDGIAQECFKAGAQWMAKKELECKNVIWLKDDNYDPLDNDWELGSVGLGHKGYYIPYSDLLKLPKEE